MTELGNAQQVNRKIQALSPLDFLIYPLLFVVCYVAWVVELSAILAMIFNNGWLLLAAYPLIPVSLKLGKILNVDPIVFGLVEP